MTQRELDDLLEEIRRLQSNAIDMILENDMHKVASNHARLEKLKKIYRQETGIDLNKKQTIDRKRR
jgi:hypothetical protein